HRLRGLARIDARAAEEEQLLDAGFRRGVNDVRGDDDVLVQEVGLLRGIGDDAADARRGDEDELRLLFAEEAVHAALIEQVELRARAGDDVHVPFALELAHDGRADEAAMAGNVDAAALFHHRVGVCKTASRSARRTSASTMRSTSCSKVVDGVQPSFAFAFDASPRRRSTSVGRRYRGSMATRVAPLAASTPTSSIPRPRQSMAIPARANARVHISRTVCVSPVAIT